MKKLLLRAAKDPFDVTSAAVTLKQNTIATNVGNLVFSNAVYKHLSADGTTVEVNGPRLNGDPADAERINEVYDAFVIPLANAFRPSFMRHLETLTKLIERLDIPVVVVGVGAQTDLGQDINAMSGMNKKVQQFVSAVLDRSATIGVRGEFTAEYLRSLGFNDVDIIGCPSMFLHGPGFRIAEPKESLRADARIAFSYTPYADGDGNLAALVASAITDYPEVAYYPQNSRDLSLLYWGDTSRLSGISGETPLQMTHPLLQAGRTRFPLDPQTWMRELSEYDFAVGSRIHGNITALLAGIPAMVLAHDSRTLELSRYFGIPHRKLSDVGEGTTVADLYSQADPSDFNKGYDGRFEHYLAFLSKNGLATCYENGDGGAAFDARMAATEFPEPVRPWADSADPEISTRIAWLKERLDELESGLNRRTKAVEARAADLESLAKTHGEQIEKLTKRISRIEHAWPQRLARRVKRVIGR